MSEQNEGPERAETRWQPQGGEQANAQPNSDWQPGWMPPPPPPPGGYAGGGWGPGWTPPPPPRPRHRVPVALTAALVVAGAAAGVGIGHGLWQSGSPTNAASSGQNSSPNNNQGGGLGQSPFGSEGGSGGSEGGSGGGFGSPFGGDESGGSGGGFGDGSQGGGLGDGSQGGLGDGSQGGTSDGTSNSAGGPADVSSIASKVSPALVDVNSTFGYQGAQGAGTGIVLTSNGEILTNNHVINGATAISVTDVGNGRTYTASVVGYDNTHDLAVLQLKNASGLQTAKIGDSSKLSVGQSVVAIGNAGGTGGTPSSAGGSITALNQSITASDELGGDSEQLSNLIEVNANIQSGDSGGSLVNSSGKVIGVDTAASDQYSFQGSGGQGYAIPINQALSIAKDITSGNGSSTIHVGQTAFLGVSVSADGQSGQSGFGSSVQGAQIADVLSGGVAAGAGLAGGDTITSVGGTSVRSATDLSKVMLGHHPGDKVKVTWVDQNGASHSAGVKLASGPPA